MSIIKAAVLLLDMLVSITTKKTGPAAKPSVMPKGIA
jgi:hypothetical protein